MRKIYRIWWNRYRYITAFVILMTVFLTVLYFFGLYIWEITHP